MKVRKSLAVFVVFVVLCSVGMVSVSASEFNASESSIRRLEPPPSQLDWQHIQSYSLTLSFNGTTANCAATITGNSGTTSISATFTLCERNANGTYTQVARWTKSTQSRILVFNQTHQIRRGVTYRLSMDATVFRNGGSERITDQRINTAP